MLYIFDFTLGPKVPLIGEVSFGTRNFYNKRTILTLTFVPFKLNYVNIQNSGLITVRDGEL